MSETIKCSLLKQSTFIEGNRCNLNILEPIITTYDKLFNLKIKYNYSINPKAENLSNKEIPYIIYGSTKIERQNLNSFFKRLTDIDYELSLTDNFYLDGIQYSKTEFFILEKIILTDLQYYVDLYMYLKSQEDCGMFIRITEFIYQPIQSIKSIVSDFKSLFFHTNQYGMTESNNIIFYAKKTADRIEEYIKSKGVAYYEDMDKRFLNSIDILIYAAYFLIKQAFETYIYKITDSPYKFTESFIINFKRILKKEKIMKNQKRILTESQYFRMEKPVNIRKFPKYLDICKLTDAEIRQKNKQKFFYTLGFFATFMLLYMIKKR